ncbi:hypothetical protein Q1695_015379 [Nippostrongylus brasiliensis]|nr:hypothetical protein Q1695_015379 [Nippostrongylus brasiliensis]
MSPVWNSFKKKREEIKERNWLISCFNHTAAVIEEKIRRSLTISRLEIVMSKVSFFVADGATVMNSTAMNLSLKYVQMLCSRDQLGSKSSYRIRASNRQCRKLLQEANLPKVLPYTDCPTRWGSMFTMICDVLDLLPAVENLIIHLKLQPFEKEEIRVLEAGACSQGSCVSMYIPVGTIVIASTRKNCNSAKRDARQFGDTLLLRHYFDVCFEYDTLQLASLMHPRPAEARRYGNPPKMSDVFGSGEDVSSSEDESAYASDEDEEEEEEEESAYL